MLLLAWCLCAAEGAGAASFEYVLDLPADRTLAYEIEFEVVHPGTLKVAAEWSPPRVLAFRLERPGQPDLRVSGPPPRSWELEVGAVEIARDTPWTLVISGLPAREAARGRLSIDLPEPLADSPPAPPVALPAPAPMRWTLPVDAPTGLSPDARRLHDATDRFRRAVVTRSTPDAYDWQDGMLRYLAERRDESPRGVSPATREMFRRIVDTVTLLDGLRQAESEPLSGPEPTEGLSRRIWLSVRDPRFSRTEVALSEVLDDLQRGHAPELEGRKWFASFLSCVIVCERHFEERARLGTERATNGDLARDQWDPILVAVDALDALVALSPAPVQAAPRREPPAGVEPDGTEPSGRTRP